MRPLIAARLKSAMLRPAPVLSLDFEPSHEIQKDFVRLLGLTI
jgi:hypothetical protein